MEHIYLKLYDPIDTYLSPASTLYDAASVLKDFPAAQHFPHIVQTDANSEMMYGFYALSAMKSRYGVTNSNPVQAVQEIEDAMNAEQEAQEEDAAAYVSPEERIAASLEFQTLMSLSDVDEEEA